jgi:N-hydroxyarylamine O-acetyltransferase
MDYQLYLKRIGYSGELHPTADTLKNLQRHHYFHVPFENLDIHLGRKISLQPENFYHKIVTHKRGGFCYELNGLFYELLLHLGFQLRMVSARVYDEDKGFGSEYDHMALIVTLEDEEWLVDVGFGEFIAEPLRIIPDIIQHDDRGKYRIELYNEKYLLVKRIKKEKEIQKYIFSLKGQPLEAFQEMCAFHQSSPDSHFTHQRVCSLPLEDGRISLAGNKLKVAHKGQPVQEFSLNDQQAFEAALKKHFGFGLEMEVL